MRLLSFSLALVFLCVLVQTAHADLVTSGTFYFNNTVLTNGPSTATVAGTVTFLNVNQVTAINFTVTADGINYSFIQNTPTFHFSPAPRDNAVTFQFADQPDPAGPKYIFGLTLRIFNGAFSLEGATLCPFGSGCRVLQNPNASTYFQSGLGAAQGYTGTTGNLQAAAPISAPTPEPSTLALLGTGIVGLVGAARRRRSVA